MFIDAANIVDLFTSSTVVHFDGDSPEISDQINSFTSNPLENTISKSRNKKNDSSQEFIYDQDSPSVFFDTAEKCINLIPFHEEQNTSFIDFSNSKDIYLQNRRLQI